MFFFSVFKSSYFLRGSRWKHLGDLYCTLRVMFDEELLNGKALMVLEMPKALESEDALRSLLQSLGNAIYSQVEEINYNLGAHESGEPTEVAGIKFRSADAVRQILDMVAVSSSARTEEIELRRGYLTVGEHKMFIEAVIRITESSGERAHSSLVEAKPVDTKLVEAKPVETVSYVINFILLYSAPTGNGIPTKAFDVYPYLVAQIFREHLTPVSIVILPTKKNPQKKCDNYRALLEVKLEDVEVLQKVFNGIIVELALPREDATGEKYSEARFRIFVNPEPAFKELTKRRRLDPGNWGEVYDPISVFPDGFVFKRRWLSDLADKVRVEKKTPLQKLRTESKYKKNAVAPATTTATQAVNKPIETSTPLPPGWTAVFSEEYQRVYYAFRCPNTGEEKTSWNLPE